jgi:hypothetical protein
LAVTAIRPAEGERRMDEGQVGQALGQVPEECPGRRVHLLGKQADVVGQADELLHQIRRLGAPALNRQGLGEPERARQERALFPARPSSPE